MTKVFIPPPTPTLDRMEEVAEPSQDIGEFLDWLLNERKLILCEVVKDRYYHPTIASIEGLLADYFCIALAEARKEQDELLMAWREYRVQQGSE